MIRERVNIHGISRSMEPPEKITALQLRPGKVGVIKEAPTIRWLRGQESWDERFKHNAKKAIKKRTRIEAKAKRLLENAQSQGLVLTQDISKDETRSHSPTSSARLRADGIQEDRRWGPLDLDDERPPPSAIAGRRDTVGFSFIPPSQSDNILVAGSSCTPQEEYLPYSPCHTQNSSQASHVRRHQGSVRSERRP